MESAQEVFDASDIEASVVDVLLDYRVRLHCASVLEDWMFTKLANRALAMTVLKPELVSKNSTINIIVLNIKQGYPELKRFELEHIVNCIKNHNAITDEDFEAVIKIISHFVKDRLQTKAINLISLGHKSEAEKLLDRAVHFRISVDSFIDPTDIEVITHLRTVSMPSTGKVIKSSLGLINRSSIYKGYKYGDLILISAPPGTCKTTWLVQEGATIADQGFKVAHLFFGDMDKFDGWVKYTSTIKNALVEKVIENYLDYMNDADLKRIMSNVRIASYPALSKTVNDVIAEAKNLKKKFDFDVLIIDYDSNILPPTDNMYESGGIMYSSFKGFAQGEQCVVFIASQPKISHWEQEIIGMDSSAESSRKQHVVDYMLTFGRNQKCKKVGTAFLPKVRRGESQMTSKIFFDYTHSRLTEISLEDYNRIVVEQSNMMTSTSDVMLEPFNDTVN